MSKTISGLPLAETLTGDELLPVVQDGNTVQATVEQVVALVGNTAVWGNIEGTLSNQTDLQTALDAKVPYTGATGNVNLGEYGLTSGYFQADLTPSGASAVGRMIWNPDFRTTDLGLGGDNVVLHIGQKQVILVVNKTGATLTGSDYQVVKISGAQGQRPKVDLAQANNDASSADTIGIVNETITNNQEGFVCTTGTITNINTTGSLQGETWADGDVLYLSGTTAGQITKIKPQAPIHTVIVGFVIYAHANQGKIYVKVDNGYELDELHNVRINGVTDGQVLAYDSTLSVWENINQSAITSGNSDKVDGYHVQVDGTGTDPNTIYFKTTGGVDPSQAIWGDITGSIVDQTDLYNALVTGSYATGNWNINASSVDGYSVQVDGTGTDPNTIYFKTTGGTISVDWDNVLNTPTTVAGYGITDVFTETESDARFLGISATAVNSDKVDGYHVQVDGTGTDPNTIYFKTTGGTTSVAWGNISGTLSAQTDLQTALDGKYPTSNPSGYITASALTPYAPINNPTFTGTVSGITKAMVGLGNVDNTADAVKSVSYATSSGNADTVDGYNVQVDGTGTDPNTIYFKTTGGSIGVDWDDISNTPTTLAGYGISDAYTIDEVDDLVVALNNELNGKVGLTGDQTIGGTKTFSSTISGSINGNANTVDGYHVQVDGTGTDPNTIYFKTTGGGVGVDWEDISNTPTTVAGYGITDAVTTSGNQTIGGTKTFSSTISGSVSGNAGTATTLQTTRSINLSNFNGSANITVPRVFALDDRTLAPADGSANYVTAYFTSWANNNTNPYADALLFRTWADGSGGNDNLVTFRKDALGMRIWQQTAGSATAFASFKDVAWTDGTNATGTWTISTSGNAGTVTNGVYTTGDQTIAGVKTFSGTSTIVNENLGIGTASPINKLTISGSSLASGELGTFAITGNTTAKRLAMGVDSTSTMYSWVQSVESGVGYRSLVLQQLGGILGVGSIPSAWSGLGGIGAIQTPSSAIVSSPGGGTNTTTFVTNAFYNGTNWIYRNTASTARYDQWGNEHRFFVAPSGTAGNAITYTQAMTLNGSGNLSIGTTVAYARVTTSYTAPASFTNAVTDYIQQWQTGTTNAIGIAISTGDTTARFVVNNSYKFAWTNSSADLMTLSGAGNLGIGITSPLAKLDVNGNIRTSAGSGGTITAFDNNSSRNNRAILGADANGAYLDSTYSNAGTGTITFRTIGTERVRISEAGNVGIGTSSPAHKLTVNGTIYSEQNGTNAILNAFLANNKYIDFQWYGSSIGGIGQDGASIQYSANLNHQFFVNGTNRATLASTGFSINTDVLAPIYYDSANTAYYLDPANTGTSLLVAGNVGIGTTSPASKLHVASGNSVNTITSLFTQGNSDGGFRAGFANGSGTTTGTEQAKVGLFYSGVTNPVTHIGFLRGGGADSAGLTFNVNTTERMRIDSAGKVLVGAGATASLGKLVVSEASSGTAVIALESQGSWNSQISSTSTGNMIFSNGTNERMRINASGDVGIGTSSPSQKLEVGGSILASGNVTAYSDIRVKDNVESIEGAIGKLSQIRGVTYTRTDLDDKERKYAGVIAQEIEQVLPEAVFDNGKVKAVDYNATIALLIEAVKEQQKRIDKLETLLNKGN